MGRAAVINLDYSLAGMPRMEHSVLYVSKDWNELEGSAKDPGLLVDPVAFFKKKRGRFLPIADEDPQHGNVRSFKFKEAPTVYLESLRSNSPESLRILTLMLSPQFVTAKDMSYSQYLTMIRGVFPEGGFVAEFAIDTSVLTIRYMPPPPERLRKARQIAGLTPVTLAMVPLQRIGHVHFDLVDAADFVKVALNYMEQGQWLIDTIKNSPEEFLYSKASLTEEAVGASPVDPTNKLSYTEPIDDPVRRNRLYLDQGLQGSPSDPTLLIDCSLYRPRRPNPGGEGVFLTSGEAQTAVDPPCFVVYTRAEGAEGSETYSLSTMEIKEYEAPR